MHRGVDLHSRKRERHASQLKPRLLEMVRVQMRVAQRDDELSWLEFADLRNHHREQRVRRDVERKPQENVGRSLIHLAREPSISDIELKKQVTRRQGHLRNLAHVPRAHDQASRIGIPSDLVDDLTDLVNPSSIRSLPRSPLRAVDRPKLAVRISPFVPDVNAMVSQVLYVCIAPQKPEQLMDDRLEMKFLGREYRKPLG